jgi:hypothetical protein
MRIILLVVLVVATAACGTYRFPGPGAETGTVHGQVVTFGCGGPIQPDIRACPAQTSIACPRPSPPISQACGARPLTGFELTFTKDGTSRIAKTDSGGAYSIDMPAGTWRVSAASYARIVDGPQTVAVSAGASIAADYVVDTGMRPAA